MDHDIVDLICGSELLAIAAKTSNPVLGRTKDVRTLLETQLLAQVMSSLQESLPSQQSIII